MAQQLKLLTPYDLADNPFGFANQVDLCGITDRKGQDTEFWPLNTHPNFAKSELNGEEANDLCGFQNRKGLPW